MENYNCNSVAARIEDTDLKTICRRIQGFPVSSGSNNSLVFWEKYDRFLKQYNKLTTGMSGSRVQLLDQVLKKYCELNT